MFPVPWSQEACRGAPALSERWSVRRDSEAPRPLPVLVLPEPRPCPLGLASPPGRAASALPLRVGPDSFLAAICSFAGFMR